MESGENEFQLAGIVVDIADREDARHRSFELPVSTGMRFSEKFEAELATGPSFMVKPIEARKRSADSIFFASAVRP